MARARDQLAAARASLESGFPPAALSLAYYAMLYAARAALSEEDRYAKTHSGTWLLFQRTFVETGRFDGELSRAAQKTLPVRLETDYEARDVSTVEAEDVIDLAARFVAAIEELYPD
jgi:uncharacterized protein (UPF0332 family)